MSKLEIAREFLLASPPGEFNDVFNDVRSLINDDGMVEDLAQIAADYDIEQLTIVEVPDAGKVVLSSFGQVAGKFLDPRSKKTFEVNHKDHTVSNVQDYDGQVENEELRSEVDEAIQKYIVDHYPEGAATVYSKDDEIIVTLSGSKLNPGNYWNGHWQSQYILKDGNVMGDILVKCHYFEDGNVQLASKQKVEAKVSGSDKSLATNLVKAIDNAEGEYQTALNEAFSNMSSTTFKYLRRPLPITRNKIDWAKISTYKIGEQLPGGTKQ